MNMNMTVRQGVSVVQVSGTLTCENSDALVTRFTAWLDLRSPARCVFDLSQLEMLDSSGIGRLVMCLHKAKSHGGEVCLAAVHDKPATVIAIARLDRIFRVFPTVDAAVQDLAGAGG